MIAVVNFRTIANGSYSWIKKGQRRGYWRVLVLKDINGSTSRSSRNVVEVLYAGPEGIDGVTSRSAYCIDDSRTEAHQVAMQWNTSHAAAVLEATRASDDGMPERAGALS
jgi:hypothetical protein